MSERLGRGNHRLLVQFVQAEPDNAMRRQKLDDPTVFAAQFNGFEEVLRRDLETARAQGAKAFLISSEHFHSRLRTIDEIAALQAVLAPVVRRFRILVWLRPQHDLRRSLYSTALQMGYRARPDTFQADRGPGHLYYNYHALLSLWAEVFGAKAIEARLYDPQRDAFEALWAAIGDLGPRPSEPRHARENTSFGRAAAQIAFAYNLSDPGPDRESEMSNRRAKVMRALRGVNAPDAPFTLPGSRAFQAQFDPTNASLFETFLPRAAFAPAEPSQAIEFEHLSPGQGARLRAVASAIDAKRSESFAARIDAFGENGGNLYDLAELFVSLRLGENPAPRKRFLGLF